jgi:hypothetical protein
MRSRAPQATAIVDRELERLTLPGWTVRVDRERDGESTCGYFYLDPDEALPDDVSRVQIVGSRAVERAPCRSWRWVIWASRL